MRVSVFRELLDRYIVYPSVYQSYAFLPRALAILIRRRDARRTVGRDRSGPSFSTSLHPLSPPGSFHHPPSYSLLTLVSLTLGILPLPLTRMYTRAHSLRLPLEKTRARIESPLVYGVFAASATLSTRTDEPSNIESGGVIEFALVSMRADRRPALKGGAPHRHLSLGPPLSDPLFAFFFSVDFLIQRTRFRVPDFTGELISPLPRTINRSNLCVAMADLRQVNGEVNRVYFPFSALD